MELRELYKKIVDAGIKADPRPLSRIKEVLKQEKETFDSLGKAEQEFFDKDKLLNIYLGFYFSHLHQYVYKCSSVRGMHEHHFKILLPLKRARTTQMVKCLHH